MELVSMIDLPGVQLRFSSILSMLIFLLLRLLIVEFASFLQHPISSDSPNHCWDVRASSILCSTENPKVGPAGDLHHG